MGVYNSSNINVAGTGQVRVAPVGTTCPTVFVSPTWDPAWIELGWTDDKGVVGNDQRTLNPVKVWQSLYPAMQLVTDRKFDFTFNLSEWTKDSFSLAFGGGSWSTVSGVSTYIPPDPSVIDLRSMAIDWKSQGYNWRWFLPRGLVDSNVQTSLTRASESLLPIQFGILGATGSAPWSVYTDHPNFITPPVWTATTAYALNALITLGAGTVKATTGGTSSATIPALPGSVGGTVTDGSVTWTRQT